MRLQIDHLSDRSSVSIAEYCIGEFGIKNFQDFTDFVLYHVTDTDYFNAIRELVLGLSPQEQRRRAREFRGSFHLIYGNVIPDANDMDLDPNQFRAITAVFVEMYRILNSQKTMYVISMPQVKGKFFLYISPENTLRFVSYSVRRYSVRTYQRVMIENALVSKLTGKESEAVEIASKGLLRSIIPEGFWDPMLLQFPKK